MSLLLLPLATALSACIQAPSEPIMTPSASTTSASAPLPSNAGAASPAFALYDERVGTSSPWYWSAGFSLVTTSSSDGPGEEIDFNEGWGLQLAVGRRFYGATEDGMTFDLELEGLYTDQDSDDNAATRPVDDLNTAGVLLNGLAAFRVAEEAEVFVGAGLGLGWLDVGTRSDSLSSFDDEDGPFLAWQLRAGVRFDLSETTDLEVGYRFLNIDDAQVDDGLGNSSFELQTQQHSLGLSVRFGH
ncbi:MAG: outer membrane beta-barrel protein [Planctomycetota bacterium]